MNGVRGGTRGDGRQRASCLLCLVAGVLVVVSGCAVGARPARPEASGQDRVSGAGLQSVGAPTVRISFAGPDGTLRSRDVRIEGAAGLSATVLAVHGAAPTMTHVAEADESVVRFPVLDGSRQGARAALLVTAPPDEPVLSPMNRQFSFGAEVRLDRRNESATPGSADNGNNVVQLGLFSDESQYKLQIDHGYPSCLVRGSQGSVFARSRDPLRPESWFALSCTRTVAGVRIHVDQLSAQGRLRVDDNLVRGPTGRLAAPSGTALAIGAKVGNDGSIPVSSSDQFNGELRSVFLSVSP